jgi:hypothetical protein
MKRALGNRTNVAMALTMVLGITLLDLIGAKVTTVRHKENGGRRGLYRDRSGFPQGLKTARDLARQLKPPAKRLPELLPASR